MILKVTKNMAGLHPLSRKDIFGKTAGSDWPPSRLRVKPGIVTSLLESLSRLLLYDFQL